MDSTRRYDVVVVGAGVFGVWVALHLGKRQKTVLLVDAYGAGNARSSSGGESRIIRMGYGADEVYTRWAQRSLVQWQEFLGFKRPGLFHETGVLWLAGEGDARVRETAATLTRCGVAIEELDRGELEKRYPQIGLDGITAGLLETHSGVLMAKRTVAALVEAAMVSGMEYRVVEIATPRRPDGSPDSPGRLTSITTSGGETIEAEQFVFACGAWLGKLFPEVLGERIFPSRQEVFFFGVPAGDLRYSPAALPTFLIQSEESYGMPDLESRGFKIALDRHGVRVDPDTQSRLVSERTAEEVRRYVARRFPGLRDAPIVETRVCQYENTSGGDFLIDRHPEMENVWFVGGGSGHGFKHGPAVGEYAVGRILDGATGEERFSLGSKGIVQRRMVY